MLQFRTSDIVVVLSVVSLSQQVVMASHQHLSTTTTTSNTSNTNASRYLGQEEDTENDTRWIFLIVSVAMILSAMIVSYCCQRKGSVGRQAQEISDAPAAETTDIEMAKEHDCKNTSTDIGEELPRKSFPSENVR